MTSYDSVLRFVDPVAEVLLARWRAPRMALFLDRDGVINADCGYVHRPGQTQWVPGIFELIQDACGQGFVPMVITNQAGIARGFYDEQQFMDYTRWMHGVFAERNTPLLATFFCPHHPESGTGKYLRECTCRKPGPDMILAAADAFAIDLAGSVLIGDKPSDIEAALAAGVGRTHLVTDNGVSLPAFSDIMRTGGCR